MSRTGFLFLFVLFALLIALSGCRMTKHVPDDRYLLSDVNIVVDDKNISKDGIKGQIRQKENLKTFGIFKIRLFWYNLSRKDKEKGLFKRIGEAPVVYDEGLKDRSKQQLEQYLMNKGYYNAIVTTNTEYKGRKAKVTYSVQANQPYKIGEISYTFKDSSLVDEILKGRVNSLIRKGSLLDVDVLGKERTRIAKMLNDSGYFRFVEEYIHYKIDTNQTSLKAHVEMIIEKAQSAKNNELVDPHKKYYIDSYELYLERPQKMLPSANRIQFTDTLKLSEYTFHYSNGILPIKESLLVRSIQSKPGALYSKRADDRTYSNLYSLRQFRFINIQHEEIAGKGDSLSGYLKGRILLPMQMRQGYSVDLEVTNTSGNYGIGGNLTYQHKNLFRGAEILDVTFRGATERQVASVNGVQSEYLVREVGAEARLLFPGFIFPFTDTWFKSEAMPQTRFSLAYNFNDLPYFTRTIANATFGYQWRSSALHSQSFNPLNMNIVRILRLDPEFESQIKDLFIKSSYSDHVISATNYTLVYNNQINNRPGNYRYYKFGAEVAGNTLWAMSRLFNRTEYVVDDPDPRFVSTYYRIFDTRFAQYIKADIDYRRGVRLNENHSIACRSFVGIGLPYGNYNVIPFERRYFTGGSNGIRAWQVRSLGPGSYTGGATEYPNQSSDIKLEANLEYRFKLIWMFEGALFLDGGNIWAINRKDNREGVVFRFDTFYKEFALGTGFGLRIVAPFFIVRADLGLKLRDPALPEGNRWIPAERKFQRSDIALNIAVGYPF